jgi:hypothetical protein
MDIAIKEFKEKFGRRLGHKFDAECAYFSKYSNSFKKILELVEQIESWHNNN